MINKFASRLIGFSKLQKLSLVISVDMVSMLSVWMIFGPPLSTAMSQNFSTGVIEIATNDLLQFFVPSFLAFIYLAVNGYYRIVIRFYDSIDTIFISVSGSLIFGFSWLVMYLRALPILSYDFLFIFILQALMLSVVLYSFLSTTRIIAKYILFSLKVSDVDAEPILIYGAGSAGKELYEALQFDKSKKIIGFFDDSTELSNRVINNIPIYSNFKKLEKLKNAYPNINVLLAIPSLSLQSRRSLISKLEKLKIAVRTVPAFHELIFDSKKMSDIQDLSINDILPNRIIEEINIHNAEAKSILVSGGGGSIGSEIVRQLISNHIGKIYILDNSEFNLFKIYEESKAYIKSKKLNTKVIPLLGDVKDANFINRIFNEYDISSIFHAAAYKHVPLIEDDQNVSTAINNNFIGTYNIAYAAASARIESFVLVSTDKAVRPKNIMGATKRLAELAVQAINKHFPNSRFCMVRFGNVINSSGSVIPTFLEQISQGGPITLTHKEVERYFMTIPEASNLVIQASELSKGGEVFILDMGDQMKILDIAKRLIHLSGRSISHSKNDDGIEIVEVGLRKGEKMFEELLISGNEVKTPNDRIFMSNEDYILYDELLDVVNETKNAIMHNNLSKIKSLLAKYVDGFAYEK